MRRPTFAQGVVAAAVAAFIVASMVAVLLPFIGVGSVVRFMVPAVALAYIVYLLASSGERTGNITTLSLWSALALVAWWVAPPLPYYLLIHAGGIWLVRSLYFYSGLFPAMLDLALSVLGIAAFVWAISRTGSVFLATWTFFLVQAVFTAIPRTVRRSASAAMPDNAAFDRARKQADAALAELARR
jgi:hypothetical protein